jgi:hypothetical protein
MKIKTNITVLLIAAHFPNFFQAQAPMDNLLGRYRGIEKQTNTTTSATGSCSIASYTILASVGYPAVSIPDSSCISVGSVAGNHTVNNDSTIRDYNVPSYINGRLYPNDSLYLHWYLACCPEYKMEFFGFKQKNDVGIIKQEKLNEIFSVYPNPCSGKLTIKNNSDPGIKAYSFESADGKKIALNQTGLNEFDVSGLAEGLYFFRIQTPEGVLSRKIIVKR